MSIQPKQVARDTLKRIAPGNYPGICAVTSASFTPVSGTIYAFALPIEPFDRPITSILLGLGAGGTGSQVGELALATSTSSLANNLLSSVNITPQVVTNLSSAGLNSGGAKNVSLSYTILANAQAWLAIRLAFSTSQPTFSNGVVCNGGTHAIRLLAAGRAMSVGVAKSMALSASGFNTGPGMCLHSL